MAEKKIIITWEGSKTSIHVEGEKETPTRELVGVLEYAKLILMEQRKQID